jgi:hypothetical protein
LAVTTGVYLLHLILLRHAFPGNMLLTGYLNDFMAMPAVLAAGWFLLPGVRAKPVALLPLLVFTAFCGLVWEFVSPLIKSSATTDPFDFLAYFAGTLAYAAARRL